MGTNRLPCGIRLFVPVAIYLVSFSMISAGVILSDRRERRISPCAKQGVLAW